MPSRTRVWGSVAVLEPQGGRQAVDPSVRTTSTSAVRRADPRSTGGGARSQESGVRSRRTVEGSVHYQARYGEHDQQSATNDDTSCLLNPGSWLLAPSDA